MLLPGPGHSTVRLPIFEPLSPTQIAAEQAALAIEQPSRALEGVVALANDTAPSLCPRLSVADLAPSHSWTEVMRFGTRRCGPSHVLQEPPRYADGSPFTEGRSRGFPSDHGVGYTLVGAPEAASPTWDGPYGCWFYHARGSGIAINVGRTLHYLTRAEAGAALNVTCSDQYCNRAAPMDKLWCSRALAAGYDSIQVARSHEAEIPELIICSGECGTQPLVSPCPPVPLRRWNYSNTTMVNSSNANAMEEQRCACSDAAQEVALNCGSATPSLTADCYNYADAEHGQYTNPCSAKQNLHARIVQRLWEG